MRHLLYIITAISIGTAACSGKEPEGKKPETLREKAAAVGRMGDRTMTKTLEKDLVGIVDSAEERAQGLEEAAAEE